MVESSELPECRWMPAKLVAGADRAAFRELSVIKGDIKNWVSAGRNLYIYSNNFGNGKTSWAIKLLLAYFHQVWAGNGFRRRGLFIPVPAFLNRSKENISRPDPEFIQMRDDISECDLVIWDDIASTKLSDYDHSLLLTHIDLRMLAGRANIFTGNADSNDISKYLGGRLASRIWNSSTLIQLKDVDKRGTTV